MTLKDLRIEYCKVAVNPPFSELFNLDVEGNEDDVEEYITWLEDKLLDLINNGKSREKTGSDFDE